MKIIHIIRQKGNSKITSVNASVFELAARQKEHGLDVSIWCIHNGSYTSPNEDLKIIPYKAPANPFKINSQMFCDLLSQRSISVFHLHGSWIPVFPKIAALLERNNISYVFTPYEGYTNSAMNKSKLATNIYFHLFEIIVLRYASKIHCIGNGELKRVEHLFKSGKTILLPHGFDMKFYPLAPDKEADNMIIGYVGKLDIHKKGLDLLVTAFIELQKTVPNSKLWIIGEGTGKRSFAKMIKNLDLTDDVILFGNKSGEEKTALIQQMHIFANLSRCEDPITSVLEASSFGIPCVVTHSTNISGFISEHNAGIVVQNGNSNEINKAFIDISRLWTKRSLLEMRFNAQRMVQIAFNWKEIILKFNQLYTS